MPTVGPILAIDQASRVTINEPHARLTFQMLRLSFRPLDDEVVKVVVSVHQLVQCTMRDIDPFYELFPPVL